MQYYRDNASKCPLRRCDFAGAKRRPGAFTVWPGRFKKKISGLSALGAILEKQEKTHTPPTRTQQQPWPISRYGTEDSVVEGVGNADGPRAKCDVGF